VTVADGRLTIDAIGGTNTKLDYALIQSFHDRREPSGHLRFFSSVGGRDGASSATLRSPQR